MENRIDWIDIAKGIGIILVYIGHCGNNINAVWIYSFHMPLFFFISGILFQKKNQPHLHFVLKKMISLFVPYILFSVINYPIVMLTGIDNTNLTHLLLHGWGRNPMWFIPILFAIEVIHHFLLCGSKLHKCVFGSFLLLLWSVKVITNKWAPYCLLEIPWFYLCFITGFMLRKILTESRIKKPFLVFFLLFTMQLLFLYIIVLPYNTNYRGQDDDFLSYLYRYILGINGTIAILYLAKTVEKDKNNFIRYILLWFGTNSMVILCTHKVLYDVAQKYNHQEFLYGGYNHIIVLFCSILIVVLYNKCIPSFISNLKFKIGKYDT